MNPVQLSFSLNDVRDGARFKILAQRFSLTERELAILVIKKFLNETFWEWNVEIGTSSDDFRVQSFIEYLNEYINGLKRTEKVGKDFRLPEKSLPGNQNRSKTRTNLGESRNRE